MKPDMTSRIIQLLIVNGLHVYALEVGSVLAALPFALVNTPGQRSHTLAVTDAIGVEQ